MKHLLLPILMIAFMASSANADMFSYDVNVDSVDTGLVDSTDFALGEVTSIDMISIDIAQTWGGDLEITLTAPDATVYTMMFDEVAAGGSGNFDMGAVAGDASLANVATYNFVAAGGTAAYADAFSGAGTYNMNIAGNGSVGSGPHAAGTWNLTINDDAAGDATSIGSVTVTFTGAAIPEPASATVALVGLGLLAVRRRR